MIEVIKQLRGVFPANLYIGGSYAINYYFPSIPFSDIDLFIKGPRVMESWAMIRLLHTIFDHIDKSDMGTYYKIKGQYMYLRCYKDGMKFDLIFVDTEDLLDTCGSTLSKLFLQVNYSQEVIVIVPSNKQVLEQIVFHKKCEIKKSNCTPSYLEKTKQRCDILGVSY